MTDPSTTIRSDARRSDLDGLTVLVVMSIGISDIIASWYGNTEVDTDLNMTVEDYMAVDGYLMLAIGTAMTVMIITRKYQHPRRFAIAQYTFIMLSFMIGVWAIIGIVIFYRTNYTCIGNSNMCNYAVVILYIKIEKLLQALFRTFTFEINYHDYIKI